jgi:enamine deaminase RidA (YjgF/YER057c/UK114 family)
MKTVINPPEMAAPTGYSYAIKKTGTPVFISGQVALDGKGNLVGANDVAAQVEQVFANLRTVVVACGGTLDDVVKITIFVTDASYRPAVGAPATFQGRSVPRQHVPGRRGAGRAAAAGGDRSGGHDRVSTVLARGSASNSAYGFARSSARQRYQLATVRYGFQRSPYFSRSLGAGSSRLLKASAKPLRMP